MGEDEDFRISIAGAQEKTALLRKDEDWFKPPGTTATTHILKPQIGQLPNGIDLSNSVENEYLCLKLLAALGVPDARTPRSPISADRRTLIVERFDRLWTRDGRLLRLPQEDCCQALSVPPTRKYQSDGGPGMRDIIELLKGSDTPEQDIATFMRACILFWMLGATDGHAKNFSIYAGPRRTLPPDPALRRADRAAGLGCAPAGRKQIKLAMSVGRNRHYPVDGSCRATSSRPPRNAGWAKLPSGHPGRASRSGISCAARGDGRPAGGFPEELAVSIIGGLQARLRLLRASDHSRRSSPAVETALTPRRSSRLCCKDSARHKPLWVRTGQELPVVVAQTIFATEPPEDPDRARGCHRHDDGLGQAGVWHLRGARGVRAGTHCRAHQGRPPGRQGSRPPRRAALQNDPGQAPPRLRRHGRPGDQRRRPMPRARRHPADALPACRAHR